MMKCIYCGWSDENQARFAVSLGIALLNAAELVDRQYGEALIVEPRNATLPPPHMDLLRGVK